MRPWLELVGEVNSVMKNSRSCHLRILFRSELRRAVDILYMHFGQANEHEKMELTVRSQRILCLSKSFTTFEVTMWSNSLHRMHVREIGL